MNLFALNTVFLAAGSVSTPVQSLGLRRSLVAWLKSDPGVVAAVGTRVYPLVIPQGKNKIPAITYQVITDPHDDDLDGPTGTAEATVQIAAVALDLKSCGAAAKAVRDLMNGFTGFVPVPGGIEVDEINLENTTDRSEEPVDGSDHWTYRIVADYLILYRVPD